MEGQTQKGKHGIRANKHKHGRQACPDTCLSDRALSMDKNGESAQSKHTMRQDPTAKNTSYYRLGLSHPYAHHQLTLDSCY